MERFWQGLKYFLYLRPSISVLRPRSASYISKTITISFPSNVEEVQTKQKIQGNQIKQKIQGKTEFLLAYYLALYRIEYYLARNLEVTFVWFPKFFRENFEIINGLCDSCKKKAVTGMKPNVYLAWYGFWHKGLKDKTNIQKFVKYSSFDLVVKESEEKSYNLNRASRFGSESSEKKDLRSLFSTHFSLESIGSSLVLSSLDNFL